MADPGADRRPRASLHVHAVAGDPCAELGPAAGQPRRAGDLRRPHPDAGRAARGDERGQRSGRGGRRRLPLRHAAADPLLPDRAGRRRPGVPAAGRADRRLRGAVRGGSRGGRVRRHRIDDGGDRAALRPLPLGALRPARAPAELSVRRDGEPPADLRDTDDPGRRPEPGLAGGPRAGALLVRQPRDQRHVARLLAERGLHRLPGAAHRRSGVRDGPRGDGGRARTAGAARRPRAARRRGPDPARRSGRPRSRRRA